MVPNLVVVDVCYRVHRPGACHEQLRARSLIEPAKTDDVLARRCQRLAGGRQDPQVGTLREQGGGEFGHALDDALTGVEDKQSLVPGKIVAEVVGLVPGGIGQLEGPSYSGGDV